jgi:hypothetical protein
MSSTARMSERLDIFLRSHTVKVREGKDQPKTRKVSKRIMPINGRSMCLYLIPKRERQ